VRDAAALPHALTVFLTGAERAAVLGALRPHGRDRRTALLAALGLTPGDRAPSPGDTTRPNVQNDINTEGAHRHG